MSGDCLFAGRFEGLRDMRPGVATLDEAAPGPPERMTSNRVLDERDDLPRECHRIVGGDEFLSRCES